MTTIPLEIVLLSCSIYLKKQDFPQILPQMPLKSAHKWINKFEISWFAYTTSLKTYNTAMIITIQHCCTITNILNIRFRIRFILLSVGYNIISALLLPIYCAFSYVLLHRRCEICEQRGSISPTTTRGSYCLNYCLWFSVYLIWLSLTLFILEISI